MSPQQCRLIMIDPKMLELSVYDGIPHLLSPVVTASAQGGGGAQMGKVREMEDRYRKMSKMGVRGVEAFNERVKKAKDKGEVLKRTSADRFRPRNRRRNRSMRTRISNSNAACPISWVVVDEVADLMMISGKEIEGAVQRLAQMARAAGIHLIAATQRPSVERDHWHQQGQFPHPHLLPGDVQDRQPYHPGRTGRRAAAGSWATCSIWRPADASSASTAPLSPTMKLKTWSGSLKSQGTPEYLDAVTEEPDEESDDRTYAFDG